MKVLSLRCGNDHRFEGWFGSEADFQSQDERHLVSCPICADSAIARLPTAPHLNVSGARPAPTPSPTAPAVVDARALQAGWVQAVRHMIASTEDVGNRFPEEARRIHHGEIAERGIRGQASREEAEALLDEGIEVFALALPEVLKGTLQ